MRCLLDISDLTVEDLDTILGLSERSVWPLVLDGKGVALLFEKPSARTRNSAEMAVVQLGGHPVTIKGDEVGLASGRESPQDLIRTLACYHALVGARVFSHRVLVEMRDELVRASLEVPVVNLLSDYSHPCQAICDLLTIR